MEPTRCVGSSHLLLLLLQLLLSCQLLQVQSLCSAPYKLEANKCVFVDIAQSYTWCSANQQCASIGGELINSYSSLKLLGSMPSLNCGCNIWLGASDLADERTTNKSGWLAINGNGILPLDDTLWRTKDPNNALQDCVAQHNDAYGKLSDNMCSGKRGFACEFLEPVPQPSLSAVTWKPTQFKRASYNPSTEYCYTDLLEVDNSLQCLAAAVNAGNSRHVLYNSKLRTCRLLLFTDAQVEQEIETSADWVKFSGHF